MVNTNQNEQNVQILYRIACEAPVPKATHDQAAQAAKQLLEAFKGEELEAPETGKKKK